MNTFSPDMSQSTKTSFKIKGRMIPREEITCRLKNFCVSLGFGPVTIHKAGFPVSGDRETDTGQMAWDAGGDVVLVVSTHVTYNPHWGGYSGLPHLLHHRSSQSDPGDNPADFLAPFLHCYRFAQENIFLSQTMQGRYLITIPTILLKTGEDCSGCKLKLHLGRIVEPVEDGTISPISIAGANHTFTISPDFCLALAELTNDLTPGRKLPIGKYLGAEYFSFAADDGVVNNDSPYSATIQPHIAEIVADSTPNLRAAQIHLQQVFVRDTARLAAEQQARSRKLLYITGLDIDMTAFTGAEEHYFVPWQAYIAPGGKTSEDEYLLTQDDLFVQLKQQDTQCFA